MLRRVRHRVKAEDAGATSEVVAVASEAAAEGSDTAFALTARL